MTMTIIIIILRWRLYYKVVVDSRSNVIGVVVTPKTTAVQWIHWCARGGARVDNLIPPFPLRKIILGHLNPRPPGHIISIILLAYICRGQLKS